MTLDEPLSADPALQADLLAHAGALRRLARGVVDADAADDVVQETWCVALRAPSRPRALGAWLATAARRLALRRARGEDRRRARERAVAAPEACVGPDETAARRASLSVLTRAVLALEEPYQTAILLRFYDDLAPREVAARTGVPVATAKSRIARGLARLRGRLENELGERGGGVRGALAFLVGPAARGAPGGHGPSNTAAAGAAATTAGAIAMGVQAKTAAGIAAAALLGAVAWRGLERDAAAPVQPHTERAAARAARPADLAAVAAEPAAMTAAAEDGARAPVASSVPPPAFEDATVPIAPERYAYEIHGLALGLDDLPAAGAEVRVAPLGSPLNAAGVADADGRFRVLFEAREPALEIALRVTSGGHTSGLRRMRVAAGRTDVALLCDAGPAPTRIQPAEPPTEEANEPDQSEAVIAIESVVEGGEGYTLRLVASPPTYTGTGWIPSFAPDSEGRGRFALAGDGCPAWSGDLGGILRYDGSTLVAGGRLEMAYLLTALAAGAAGPSPPPATALSGVVRDAAGRPVAGALVVLGTEPGRGDGPRVESGADGRYAFPPDVEPRAWHARAGGGDHGLATRIVEVREGRETVWDPVLDRGLEIRGRVVDAETGAPLPGVAVLARGPDREDRTLTGEDGGFAIPNLPRRAFDLLARAPGAPIGAEAPLARAVVPGGDGTAYALAPEVARGIAVRVEREDGRPERGAVARVWSLATGAGIELPPFASSSAGDDGPSGFGAADALPAGAYEVEVLSPDRAPVRIGPLALGGPASDAPPTAESADLGAPARLAARGTLELREVADARVAQRWIARIYRIERGARLLVLEEREPLPERLDLAPGRYELDLVPAPDHPNVAAARERGAAPEARRYAFEVRSGERLRVGVRRGADAAAAGPLAADADPPADADPATGADGQAIADLSGADHAARLAHVLLSVSRRTMLATPESRRCAQCH